MKCNDCGSMKLKKISKILQFSYVKRKNKLIILIILFIFGFISPIKVYGDMKDGYYSSVNSSYSSNIKFINNDIINDSNNYENLKFILIPLVIIIIFFIIGEFIYIIMKRKLTSRKYKVNDSNSSNVVVSYEEKEKIIKNNTFKRLLDDITISELKDIVFNIYKEVQYARSDFNYNELRMLVTDELFDKYSSQLNILKLKDQTNIIKDIVLENIEILNVTNDNGDICVKCILKVEYYNYVIDNITNKVLRGSKKHKVSSKYIITLLKKLDEYDIATKCPNCGANIETDSRDKCKYCDSLLEERIGNYVMAKKECIGQRLLYDAYGGNKNEKKE